MALSEGYGILTGVAVDFQPATSGSGHFQIHVVDDTTDYRIAINAKSKYSPHDLEFILVADFQHPLTQKLPELELGLKMLPKKAADRRETGLGLDFLRMNLFDRTKMKKVPMSADGPDNDLNDALGRYTDALMGNEDNRIYAFGEPWGPEPNKKDKYFGFKPGNGIHNIHFNQGSLKAAHAGEDGVYQDGALVFYFAAENRYVGYFTKFQSQTWHTHDETGKAIGTDNTPLPPVNDVNPVAPPPVPADVRIVAAMVNPVGPDPGNEFVTLVNTTAKPINMKEWALLDKMDRSFVLDLTLGGGDTAKITVPASSPFTLGNNGGTITLVNKAGLFVHGVAYTKQQVGNVGETVTFN